MNYTILPRSTGLHHSLRALSSCVPDLQLLDITVAYPGTSHFISVTSRLNWPFQEFPPRDTHYRITLCDLLSLMAYLLPSFICTSADLTWPRKYPSAIYLKPAVIPEPYHMTLLTGKWFKFLRMSGRRLILGYGIVGPRKTNLSNTFTTLAHSHRLSKNILRSTCRFS
jgi:hypothetical protein